jgi:ribonuclease P protein component
LQKITEDNSQSLRLQNTGQSQKSFKKQERLTHRLAISKLFKEGNSFYIYPLRIIWLPMEIEGNYPLKILITTRKNELKKAVDRNRVKRLLREAYRNNKNILNNYLLSKKRGCYLAFIYTDNKIVSYQRIESIIILILKRLLKEYEKSTW